MKPKDEALFMEDEKFLEYEEQEREILEDENYSAGWADYYDNDSLAPNRNR